MGLLRLAGQARDAVPFEEYDYFEGGGQHQLPRPPRPPAPPPQVADYERLKDFPPRTLDLRNLGVLLAKRHPALLQHLRALRTVRSFRDTFLADPRPAGNAPRLTAMRPHLWRQLEASGAVVPVPRPTRRPYSCALRLVPDRKAAGVARVIFPVVPLNDACRRPPPTPTPRLHALLDAVLCRKYVCTADAKGWFFALAIPVAVAAAFFAVRRTSGWYAARRGLLGWTWMPYLMASVAVAMLVEAVSRAAPGAAAFVWIDNFVVATDDAASGAAVMRQLQAVADHVGATLHEVTPPCTKARIVGTEVDLAQRTWRLSTPWTEGFVAKASRTDTARTLPCRDLWRLMGAASWAAYAAQLPQVWLGPLYDYAASLAKDMAAGRRAMRDTVPYPRRVRDCIRAAATYAARNPWRRFGAAPTRPVFTDASGDGGVGLVVPRRAGLYDVHAQRVADPPHINVLELEAAARGLELSSPPPGSTVRLVVDNAVAAYQLARYAASSPAARKLLTRVVEWAARRGVAVDPLLTPSEYQAADGPSRWGQAAVKRNVPFDPGQLQRRAKRVRRDRAAVSIIPPGWHRPVPRKAFFRIAERVCGSGEVRIPA